MFRKCRPYEGSCHIPLILSGPKPLIGGKEGQVCHNVVELRDLMPTFLDLAHAPVPEEVDGKSILPMVEKPEEGIRPWLHGEHLYGEESNHYIVTERDKYIWYSQRGEEQYFDLSKDPREQHNAVCDAEYQERVRQMRSWMIEALEGREEQFVEQGRLKTGAPMIGCLKNSLVNG